MGSDLVKCWGVDAPGQRHQVERADRFATRTAWQPGRPDDGGGVANEAPNRSLVLPAVRVIVPPPGSRFAERPASGRNGS
jgi:hypothetical protein